MGLYRLCKSVGSEVLEKLDNKLEVGYKYDPKWSTFISVDPLAEKTMDAYGYCYQNPINLVDPDGREAEYKINCENYTS